MADFYFTTLVFNDHGFFPDSYMIELKGTKVEMKINRSLSDQIEKKIVLVFLFVDLTSQESFESLTRVFEPKKYSFRKDAEIILLRKTLEKEDNVFENAIELAKDFANKNELRYSEINSEECIYESVAILLEKFHNGALDWQHFSDNINIDFKNARN
eukprot:TRINITY_DN9191_c0_g1_i1.p1 TRINITY_DN9191_c0_g1~~TRINITY_DN9191_c0_g1_i1.p1  ORF type:complete len:157 (-),score=20.37 TRINITY_DN9191_c0_g1_i1:124-594(-)